MTARTHDVAAITFLGVVFLLSPLEKISITTFVLCILFNQIGGILPDIDQPTAPFWKNLPLSRPIGRLVDKTLFGGHRFITHSILGLVMFSLLLAFLFKLLKPTSISFHLVLVSFIVGYLSHLILDSFTKEGVPWLIPMTKKLGFPPIKRLRMTTGSIIEFAVVLPAMVIFDLVLITQNYNFILIFLRNYLVR